MPSLLAIFESNSVIHMKRGAFGNPFDFTAAVTTLGQKPSECLHTVCLGSLSLDFSVGCNPVRTAPGPGDDMIRTLHRYLRAQHRLKSS